MNVRAKFICVSMRKYSATIYQDGHYVPGFMYEYEFYPVTGTSEENTKFFASTPTGLLKMGTVRDDLFVPGQEYYLDFSPVPETQ